jgi:ATP-dependent HslUV protease ATP-binding subunit HslU
MREGELTPRRIVAELDRFIVGQAAAKRAVAVALRNRYRRRQLPPPLAEEVMPRNILLIGPTGVGKTEIARRLARLVAAPFVKVEATRFTEVGYVGRDVESIVRDLAEAAYQLVREEHAQRVREEAERAVEARLVDLLVNPPPPPSPSGASPWEVLLGTPSPPPPPPPPPQGTRRGEYLVRLRAGELEDWPVEVDVEVRGASLPLVGLGFGSPGDGQGLGEVLGNLLPRRRQRRRLTVAQARPLLLQEEIERRIDPEAIASEAVRRAEEDGIVFLDELDKVAATGRTVGPDVSREGVQRDLLPVVEGTTVNTRYGPVRTDHVLFIGAGAFHVAKPSDLIPELQGRFPIRVELEPLSAAEFERILTEPENALTRQYQALLAADGVELTFTPEGIRALATYAQRLNESLEDIGARRLATLLERVLEDVSFEAPERQGTVVVDEAYVVQRVEELVADQNLARYIL